MDIRQLKYFLSVMEGNGLAAAADTHFVTQPAVSLQLRRLEAEIGDTLFVRDGRRLVPTELARVLQREATEVVQRMEHLEATMRSVRGLEQGRLRVGNIDAASVYVLPDVYHAFHERYPGVAVKITVGDTTELLDALRRGAVELATTTLPVDAPELTVREVYREELVAVCDPANPLVGSTRQRLRALAQEGVITYPAGATTRRLIESVFETAGLRLRARMEISSPEAMKRLSEAGLGAAILPLPVVKQELKSGVLVRIPTGAHRFERAIGMVYREDAALSPAARAFLAMVIERTS